MDSETKLKILIVDDNELNRELLCELLQPDYDIVEAASGEEALEIIDRQYSGFSLILLDVIMPGISGLDVLREISGRNNPEWVPVIIISSDTQDGFEDQALLLGASDYAIRPYDITFLKKRIQNCITLSNRQKAEITVINDTAAKLAGTISGEVSPESLLISLHHLRSIYDSVRLVDVSQMVEYSLSEDGVIRSSLHKCFEVWNKGSRCENCISSRTLHDRKTHTKYEFINREIYLITSTYVEVDRTPFVLELVSKVNDDVFLDAVGQDRLIRSVLSENSKIFLDALTGVYNRRYYDEQISHLPVSALAIIDIDHFKSVNDTYGHLAGDEVIQKISAKIKSMIRNTDALIRYGGDEFVLVFVDINPNALYSKLDTIREAVENMEYEKCPGAHITLSIGAVTTDKCNNEAVGKADRLLYKAKETRNCVVVNR